MAMSSNILTAIELTRRIRVAEQSERRSPTPSVALEKSCRELLDEAAELNFSLDDVIDAVRQSLRTLEPSKPNSN